MTLSDSVRHARTANDRLEFWLDGHPRLYAGTAPPQYAVADTLAHRLGDERDARNLARDITGVTTNPNLIEQYDTAVRRRAPTVLRRSADTRDLRYHRHVASAAETMGEMHKSSGGRYGWVSAQVSPAHTFDTRALVTDGLRLSALGDNVMVKVPGSQQGYAAIEQLVGAGVSVNGTLSFSLAQFEAFGTAVAAARQRLDRTENDETRTVVTHMAGRVGDALRSYADVDRSDARAIRLVETALARRGSDLIGEIEPRSSVLISSIRVDAGAGEECLHLTGTLDKPVAYTITPDTYARLRLVDTGKLIRPDARLLEELDAVEPGGPAYELIRPLFDRRLPAAEFWTLPQFLQTLAEASSSHLKLIGGVHAA